MALAYTDKIKAEILADIERQTAAMLGINASFAKQCVMDQYAADMAERRVMTYETDEACKEQVAVLVEDFAGRLSMPKTAPEGVCIPLEPGGWLLPVASLPSPEYRRSYPFGGQPEDEPGESVEFLAKDAVAATLPYQEGQLIDKWPEAPSLPVVSLSSVLPKDVAVGTCTLLQPEDVGFVGLIAEPEPPKKPQRPVGFRHSSTKHTLDKSLSVWGHMGYRRK